MGNFKYFFIESWEDSWEILVLNSEPWEISWEISESWEFVGNFEGNFTQGAALLQRPRPVPAGNFINIFRIHPGKSRDCWTRYMGAATESCIAQSRAAV